MIQPQQMQDRGVKVMHVNLLVNRAETEFVQFAERHATPHAPACEPSAEAVWIMPSAVSVRATRAVLQVLVVRGPPELARPNQ